MAKIAIILSNLGTPKEPTTKAVSVYLKQFLSDRRVIDVKPIIWRPILSLIRLMRSPRVAKIYQSVWSENGSPLLEITHHQQDGLLQELQQIYPQHEISIHVGMSYQEPALDKVTTEVFNSEPDHVILLPLYPQFSSTTVLPVIDAFNRGFQNHRQRFIPPYTIVNNYCAHPLYIQALVNSLKDHLKEEFNTEVEPKEFFSAQHPLFVSYHAIPTRYVTELNDPYAKQCEITTKLLVKALGLSEDQYKMTYQSVFGKEPWLTPQTDKTLITHAQAYNQQGQASDQDKAGATIICPCFSVDCIETLEENGMENRHLFKEAGGSEVNYSVVPCLNDRQDHIDALANILTDYINLGIRESLDQYK